MTPKISLIMTVHNRERFLAVALESLLAQTYRDFELLIWDDGSEDHSLKIAQAYARQDSRLRVFAGPHQGRTRALQAAHAVAQGTYLGWVDSDDWLAPTALAATVSPLETHPNIGMVYTNYLVVNEMGTVQGLGSRCQIPYSKDQLLLDFMTFHFRLFRHSAFVAAGGIDPYFPVAIDYDLCLRLSEVTLIQHLEQPLYYYRTHRDSLSQTDRLQQTYYAREAMVRALQRRGLADRYQIDVQLECRFSLIPRTQ
ncbi:MAG: glycosyltransferase [Acaryochloris sp. RU_4_1]|nr:glycosyltransferase [Acaryochloris sp. RU_4_1]NJR54624.1 glycosyltransferase [Acaryochloris sp. CRU_2_0]